MSRIRPILPETTKVAAGRVIDDIGIRQRRTQTVTVELRVSTGTGLGSNVDQGSHTDRTQQLDELIDPAITVADGVHNSLRICHPRSPSRRFSYLL